MRLFHVTPLKNRASILSRGLLCKFAQRNPRIWLVSQFKLDWAYRHIQSHYRTPLVIVLRVSINRRQLTRYQRGVYYSTADIQPSKIK